MTIRLITCLLAITTGILPALAQYDYEFGHWESGFWKKFIKTAEDSNKFVVVHYGDKTVMYQGEIRDGKPVGIWKHYACPDKVIRESAYNGKFAEYDRDGVKVISGQFSDGVPVGKWYYYTKINFNCDSTYVYKEIDLDSNVVINYNLTDEYYDCECPDKDEAVKNSYTDNQKNANAEIDKIFKPEIVNSLDLKAGQNPLNLDPLNELFYKQFGQRFETMPYQYSIGITMGDANGAFWQINYSRTIGSSVTTDSTSYKLRGGEGFSMLFGYDVVKENLVSLMPYFGYGRNTLKLNYNGSDQDHKNNLVNDISVPGKDINTNELFEEIKFKSTHFVLDGGAEIRLNIPFSKYHWRGFYLGLKGGYLLSLSSGRWKYRIPEVSRKKRKADFLPRTNPSGLYWMVTLGFFTL